MCSRKESSKGVVMNYSCKANLCIEPRFYLCCQLARGRFCFHFIMFMSSSKKQNLTEFDNHTL